MMTKPPHLKPPPQFSPRGLLAVIVIVAAILLLFSYLPAGAQAQPPSEPQQCAPPDVVVSSIAAKHPVDKMIVLDPDQTLRVSAWFDAQPPVSDSHFDLAILLKHVGGNFGLLLGRGGEVCKALLVRDEFVPALIQAILGPHAGLPIVLVQDTPAIHHHDGMSATVDRFYSTWFMPDNPNKSCCNTSDCYPTQARFRDGQWWALRREDGEWLPIPTAKIERNRDNPDGQSHLCAPPPKNLNYAPKEVFCFSLGGGT